MSRLNFVRNITYVMKSFQSAKVLVHFPHTYYSLVHTYSTAACLLTTLHPFAVMENWNLRQIA